MAKPATQSKPPTHTKVDWLFDVMLAEFGGSWKMMYPLKKTRVVKNAKKLWAIDIEPYDRAFLERIIKKARAQSSAAPSQLAFWSMCQLEKAKEQEQNPKPPPNRALGVSALAGLKSSLNEFVGPVKYNKPL